MVRRELAQAPQPGCLVAGAGEVEGVEQVGADLVVLDIDVALVRREGVEQRQRSVVALVDEEHEVIDVTDLLQPLGEAEQARAAGGQRQQVGDTGGPVLEFLGTHHGIV